MTAVAAPRSRRAADLVLLVVPWVLAVVAEAAWISVVGGLIQEFSQRTPELGIPVLAAVVAAGAIVARGLGPRAGPAWPFLALGLAVVAAIGGSLASPAARDALATGGLGAAVAAHPGGLVAGLALFRGFAHARLPPAEGTLARMLGIGAPGLALAALLGGVIAEPSRSAFLADALLASIVFLGSTILALALVRLGSIGDDRGLDWTRNPAWIALAAGLLLGAIALALPMAGYVGPAIGFLFGLALGPLVVLGFFGGMDRAGRRILIFFGILVAIVWLRSLIGRSFLPNIAEMLGLTNQTTSPVADQVVTFGLGGIFVATAVVSALVLAALWLRRSRARDEDPVRETRRVDRGDHDVAQTRGGRWRFARTPEPRTAAEAYLALIDEIERHPAVRREPAETPREHAARLRSVEDDLSLDLLAADYALVRDGGRALSPREEVRAIARWRGLRRRLAQRPPLLPTVAPVEDREAPAPGEPAEGARAGLRHN